MSEPPAQLDDPPATPGGRSTSAPEDERRPAAAERQQGAWFSAWAINSALFLAFLVAMLLVAGDFPGSGRPFAYPLDDTYIHLALGHSLALTGTWGVTPGSPAAASSSPLWTLLLALAAKVLPSTWHDAYEVAPLILSALAGVGWIALVCRIFSASKWTFLIGLAGWMFVALPALTLVGMEHGLHVLVSLALVWRGAELLSADREPSGAENLGLGLLASVAAATRYESLFLVALLVMLALVRRRFLTACAVGVGAAVPVLGFGFYWMKHGGFFLPNPLLLKGAGAGSAGNRSFWTRLSDVPRNFLGNVRVMPGGRPLLAVSELLVLVLLVRRNPRRLSMFVTLFLGATLMQLCFASIGWLGRYEAWLFGLAFVAVLLLAGDLARGPSPRARRVAPWLVLGVLLLFAPRAVTETIHSVQAVDDRRWEHLATVRLVGRFFGGDTVLANDIGLMAYEAGYQRAAPRVIDIFGLGYNDAVRLRPMGVAGFSRIARDTGARIAVVQPCWNTIAERIPSNWKLVGFWVGPRNVVFPHTIVAYFAVAADAEKPLAAALAATPPPAGVQFYDSRTLWVRRFNQPSEREKARADMCEDW